VKGYIAATKMGTKKNL